MYINPMQRIQLRGELDPAKFYALVDMIQKVKASERPEALKDLEGRLKGLCEVIDQDVESLTKANSAMLAELRQTTRMRNPLLPEEQENPFADLRHTSGGQNFLRVIYDVFMTMQLAIHEMTSLTEKCQPGTLTTTGRKINEIKNLEDLQFLNFEISMNQAVVNRFIEGILSIAYARNLVVETGRSVVLRLDSYYRALMHRHSVEGIEIHGKSPVVTDVAMSIYENIDSHGEVSEDGKKPTELSAYSMRKAMIMADAVRNGPVGYYVREPLKMIEHLTQHLQGLWALMELLEAMYEHQVKDLKSLLGIKDMSRPMSGRDFNEAIEMLKDLDPQTIVFKEKTGLLTPEERFELKFRNETLKCLVELLRDGAPPPVMIDYVLGRKAAWRKYLNEENSFFVCKISAGNPFLGEAPGALQVVPGTRPNIRMEEILGMGFDEVRQHFATVEASAEWYDLFVATSPSKSGDKSHILLIGPQGCGKSEVFRAVGGDKKSIGIFAQGSDFLTCWKGEAEKNPKRLFEGAIKIQKDTGKHVHIMIDEIDTVLNKDAGQNSFGGTNLVTEFQILMDGVIHYPHLSVWGATNVPERIPMPMLRRFSKVLVVGELSQEDRVKLLKGFAGFMPLAEMLPHVWEDLAQKLEGATGDVIRKVVDHVWRTKMTAFVDKHPTEAKALLQSLNNGTKFSISEFTSEKRAAFHEKLRAFPAALIHGEDLERSVDMHLDNVAVHNEIKTAVETYDRARAFLASIQAKRVQA